VGQCNAKVPPRLMPLKTKPAVDIPRGSEVSVNIWAHIALQVLLVMLASERAMGSGAGGSLP
jgi:hypothetical protein